MLTYHHYDIYTMYFICIYFLLFSFFFFFNDTATTEIYTLSLHDALPISIAREMDSVGGMLDAFTSKEQICFNAKILDERSEEHTSELQSQSNLVCRLLLEKKKKKNNIHIHSRIS